MRGKELRNIAIRYIFLLVVSFFMLDLLYFVLTPLTLYPVLFVLSLLYKGAYLADMHNIIIGRDTISLVPACIAGAAYFLLLILNFATPMRSRTRINSILFLFVSFLILNILRIAVFSFLFVSRFSYFDIAHYMTWYIGSTFLVAFLWFTSAWIFKIEEIPFYSDIKYLSKAYSSKK